MIRVIPLQSIPKGHLKECIELFGLPYETQQKDITEGVCSLSEKDISIEISEADKKLLPLRALIQNCRKCLKLSSENLSQQCEFAPLIENKQNRTCRDNHRRNLIRKKLGGHLLLKTQVCIARLNSEKSYALACGN